MSTATRVCNPVADIVAGAFPSLQPLNTERRSGFGRRDERRQQIRWPEVDRRQAEARRADDILAARLTDHLECL